MKDKAFHKRVEDEIEKIREQAAHDAGLLKDFADMSERLTGTTKKAADLLDKVSEQEDLCKDLDGTLSMCKEFVELFGDDDSDEEMDVN